MEQSRESTDDLDAMEGRRWSEFLPTADGKAERKLLQHNGRCSEGEEDEDNEDGGGSLHSLQSHVTFASLPSYMRSKSGLEMDPDRVSSCLLTHTLRMYKASLSLCLTFLLLLYEYRLQVFDCLTEVFNPPEARNIIRDIAHNRRDCRLSDSHFCMRDTT